MVSEEGLLYNYISDPDGRPDMEVPRLVPPEGDIRLELIEDAIDELEVGSRSSSAGKVSSILQTRYFWEEMLEDVEGLLGRVIKGIRHVGVLLACFRAA